MLRPRKSPASVGAALLAAWLVALPTAALADTDDCPDAVITADVKSRLALKHPIGALKINIDTEKCVVTLKGCMDTPGQINAAVKSAKKVKKVKSVHNQLTVCPKGQD